VAIITKGAQSSSSGQVNNFMYYLNYLHLPILQDGGGFNVIPVAGGASGVVGE